MSITVIAHHGNPWDDLDKPGRGHGKPVVPEVSAYGVIFMLVSLLILLTIRRNRRR